MNQPRAPEPCRRPPCKTPVACAEFAYCRKRNLPGRGPTQEEVQQFRAAAHVAREAQRRR